LNGARICLRHPLVFEIPSSEIQIVSVGVAGLSPPEPVQAFGRKPEPHLLGNGGAQLPLHAKHADRLTIVRGRPHLHLGTHLNQLRGDAQSTALGANRAFDEVIGTQLASDLSQ